MSGRKNNLGLGKEKKPRLGLTIQKRGRRGSANKELEGKKKHYIHLGFIRRETRGA